MVKIDVFTGEFLTSSAEAEKIAGTTAKNEVDFLRNTSEFSSFVVEFVDAGDVFFVGQPIRAGYADVKEFVKAHRFTSNKEVLLVVRFLELKGVKTIVHCFK